MFLIVVGFRFLGSDAGDLFDAPVSVSFEFAVTGATELRPVAGPWARFGARRVAQVQLLFKCPSRFNLAHFSWRLGTVDFSGSVGRVV